MISISSIPNSPKKAELEKVLLEVRNQMNSTVINYPKRDPEGFTWGKPAYNGNCSGKVPLGFIDKLGAQSVCELFSGSATLYDVCLDYGIKYTAGVDLNPTSLRPNIFSMDITNLEEELPQGFYEADMCFSHPPYPGINHIKYAGKEWEDKTGLLASRDIQNKTFYEGMKLVNISTMRAFTALPKGSYLVLLVGEIRSNGQYYSMMQHLHLPELFQTYIKIQNNTWSGRQNYSSTANPRAFTAHEMIAVMKKKSGFEIACVVPKNVVLDIRDSIYLASWDTILHTALTNLDGEAYLQDIYDQIKGHKKCETNQNWEAKIRQTLQRGRYERTGKGKWKIAS